MPPNRAAPSVVEPVTAMMLASHWPLPTTEELVGDAPGGTAKAKLRGKPHESARATVAGAIRYGVSAIVDWTAFIAGFRTVALIFSPAVRCCSSAVY